MSGEPRSSDPNETRDGPGHALEDLRGLPRFASVVAHELRNPLSAVKIALQTLERHAQLKPKDSTRLSIALREVATIERVLSDLLDWARPPEPQLESVSAAQVLSAALIECEGDLADRRLELVRDETSGASVRGDAERLTLALAELVRNAAQASPPEGIVRVAVLQNDESVRFIVDDDGPGMSEEDAARAFEPFFSGRARGIGLGLTRALDTARSLGGDVELTKKERGMRAVLHLPRG